MKFFDVEITGSFNVSGSSNDIVNITSSYAITASYVSGSSSVSASYALSSSYSDTAQTLLGSVTSASYALTASYADNAGSAGGSSEIFTQFTFDTMSYSQSEILSPLTLTDDKFQISVVETVQKEGIDENTMMMLSFDQSTGVIYDKTGKQTGLTTGSATFITFPLDTYYFGNSSAFFQNHDDAYVDVPYDTASFDMSGSYTIDFWINPTAISRYHSVFSNGTGLNFRSFFAIVPGNTMTFGQYVDGGNKFTANSVAIPNWQVGNWYHIAMVKNPFGTANQVLYFINGELLSDVTSSEDWMGVESPIRIGTTYYPTTTTTNTYAHIDELRYSNIARWTASFGLLTTPYEVTASEKEVATIGGEGNLTGYSAIVSSSNTDITVTKLTAGKSTDVKFNIVTSSAGVGGGASTFLDLTDTPNSYTGQSSKVLRVSSSENEIEFGDIPTGLIATWTTQSAVNNTNTMTDSGGTYNYLTYQIDVGSPFKLVSMSYEPFSSGTFDVYLSPAIDAQTTISTLFIESASFLAGQTNWFDTNSKVFWIGSYYFTFHRQETADKITRSTVDWVSALGTFGDSYYDGFGAASESPAASMSFEQFVTLEDYGSVTASYAETASHAITASYAETAGGITIWSPDAPPISSSALDDEFNDSDFATGSLWATNDVSGLMTITETSNGLILKQTADALDDVTGIYQLIPSGNFTIYARGGFVNGQQANHQSHGIALFEDATGDNGIYTFGKNMNAADYNINIIRWNSSTSFNSAIVTDLIGNQVIQVPYQRVARTGTTYTYDVSGDGINWSRMHSFSLVFVPNHFGLYVNGTGLSFDMYANFTFFRYLDSFDDTTPIGRYITI